MLKTLVALTLLAALLTTCDSEETERAIAQEQQFAEQEGQRQAAREAELALMLDTTRAIPALEQRLAASLSIEPGFLVITQGSEDRFVIHTVPLSTPWRVTCERGAISLTFGPWFEMNDKSSEPIVSIDLSHARLSKEQCLPLILGIARRLALMTK